MKLYILGAGKYGRVIEDIAEQTGKYDKIFFLDDMATCAIGKCGDFIKYIAGDAEFFVAFGDNAMRQKWIEQIVGTPAVLTTIIHPTAYISPKAKIKSGCAVLPKALINTNSVLSRGVIINSGVIIDHDVSVGEFAHICVGAIVKADNKIPAGIKIEAGVVIERAEYK